MKEGWEYKKLGEVCNIDFGTRVVRSRDAGSIYPVYGGGGATFKMDIYNREDCMVISRFGMSEQCTRFVKGKFFLNDSGLTLSMKKDCMIQKFMDWQIFHLNNTIYSLGRGAAQKNLDTKALAEVVIAYPNNLSEQQSIIDYLDSAFAKIDAMKANAEKALGEAKALFQASLKEMLEPKEGWEEKTLREVCSDIVDCPHTTPQKVGFPTQYPCIRTSELKGGSIDWSTMQYLDEDEYKKRVSRLVPKPNELVYGREGTYGDAVLLPDGYSFSLGQRTMLLRPNEIYIIPRFLLYSMISPHVYQQAKAKNSGCGVGHVNVKDIKVFRIGLPTIDIQQSIVANLDSLKSKVDRLQENYAKISQECAALKQAILRKVFE